MRRLGWLLALLPVTALADLFSPGELSKAHANLAGLKNCTGCHPAGGQLDQQTCLACHTELAPQVTDGTGFHGRMPSEKRACQECHREHQGRSARLIDWPHGGIKAFDHKKTGWPLSGKHLPTGCAACHEKRLVVAPAIVALLSKQPGRETFLGTATDCKGCHFDDHRGQVSTDCASCHDERAWKPAPDFNHDETDYPLKGKHQKVKCDACHPRLNDEKTPKGAFPAPVFGTFMKFAPLDFNSCLDCHKDPHENRLGPRCTGCHTLQSWKQIRDAKLERAFHEKTRYPLRGDHLDVECKDCHAPVQGQKARFKGLPHAVCVDCHVDAHLGQLRATAGRGPDCAECHAVEGFTPVRYTAEQHRKTRFPLEAAHQVVACAACHPKTSAMTERVTRAIRAEPRRRRTPAMFSFAALDFSRPLAACDSCHSDVHLGQFKARVGGCAGCHQPSSLRQVKFNHDQDSRYPLTGLHAKVECAKCHTPAAVGKPVRYQPLPLTCAPCHLDVHAGQFAPGPGRPTECEKCHTTSSFKVEKFDHAPPATAYALEGKHATAKCVTCHPRVVVARGVEAARYKPLPQTCEGCHQDFHEGAFKDFTP